MMILPQTRWVMAWVLLLSPCWVHSLLSLKKIGHGVHHRHYNTVHKQKHYLLKNQRASSLHSSNPISTIGKDSSNPQTNNDNEVQKSPHIYELLNSYTFHWESLLSQEYQDTARELQQRRKNYTRSQLEASGLAVFNAVASPETELYGEKIVRVTIPQRGMHNGNGSEKKLREKFKRGDVLLLTPQILFKGKDVPPREGIVTDVGADHINLGVGTSWPAGVMEMRKHNDGYVVRLDRSLSTVPLRAQKMGLEKLRKGEAGDAAGLFVRLFYDADDNGGNKKRRRGSALDDAVREIPSHFDDGSCEDGCSSSSLEERIEIAMEEAVSQTTFRPNPSQREAVVWALQQKLGLVRGPPGTGKTRVGALMIATALKMKLAQEMEVDDNAGGEEGENGGEGGNDDATTAKRTTPRILAVTHSNGAADVLLKVLLQMNVPAVRAGRPASVSPSIQHRTIAALSERLPEVVKLRQQAGDATLDSHVRRSAVNDAKKFTNDAQTMIAKSAPVIVASCIGAQQLLSSIGENDDGSTFPIVVLDEAGQTTEPALICALAAAKARQVILVGDTKQLPPTVTTQDAELRKTIGISPMERLLKNGIDEFVLKEQYRMPESLLAHPNKYFYEGVVRCAASGGADPDVAPPDGFPWPNSTEPLAFLKIGKDSEVAHNFGGKSNPTEVEVILDIVEKVIAAGDIEAKNIAIITPYNKQVQLFRTELSNASINSNGSKAMADVQVGTVDSFQGQETDMVIFSAVRSNLLKELGFLRDARRLNVAITRARRGLVVVGDPTVLRTCQHWTALMDSCTERGCIITHEEYNSNNIEAILVKEAKGREKRNVNVELDMDDEFYGLF